MSRATTQIRVLEVDSPISALTGTTNCVVMWRGKVAVVVDPGGEGERIVRFIRRNRLTVGEYWLTHGHPDHVGGLSELLEAFPAPVRYHQDDSWWVKLSLPILSRRNSDWFCPFGGIRKIACGDVCAKVIHTPGHTPGGVCFWLEKEGVLLTGDTLMRGCVGATIYPGGNKDKLENSHRRIFRKIPDNTKIIAGHGSSTTVGRERS